MSKLALQPAPGYCIISPITSGENPTGIIIKQENQPFYQRGWIRRMGKERCEFGVFLSCPAKEGDSVYYNASEFESITFNGEQIQIVNQSAIVAIYESQPETSN